MAYRKFWEETVSHISQLKSSETGSELVSHFLPKKLKKVTECQGGEVELFSQNCYCKVMVYACVQRHTQTKVRLLLYKIDVRPLLLKSQIRKWELVFLYKFK